MNTDLASSDQLKLSSGAVFGLRSVMVMVGLAFIGWAFSDDLRIVGGPGFGLTQATLVAIGMANLVASAMRVNILLGLLVIQTAMFGTLITAELLLRGTLGHRYYTPFQLDQRYLYNLIPNARRAYRHAPINGGHEVIYEINAHGFRGPALATDLSDITRIVVYGDSFIQAEYTALGETFPKQLERILTERTNRKFEVINAGVAGYGPDQVLRRVEDELDWLNPDLLIVGIFAGNDFGDLVRNKLYRLSPSGELTPNAYEYSGEILFNASLEKRELILKRVARDARDRFRARLADPSDPDFDPEAAIEAALQQHLNEYHEFVIDRDDVVRNLRVDPYSADISLLPGSPSSDYKLAKMEAVIAEIKTTAVSRDVPLLVMIIPHPMDVMGGAHASGVVNLSKYPDYQPARLTDSLQDIVKRHDIRHVNLYSHFALATDPAALYLRGGDDHWNSEGQNTAAKIVADYLLAASFYQPRAEPDRSGRKGALWRTFSDLAGHYNTVGSERIGILCRY